MLEGSATAALWPLLRRLPRGDGHPVLVLPGFLATSRSTAMLRSFLQEQGYAAHRWRQGRNRGFSPTLERRMQDRVKRLTDQHGERVSLVGWSLGGIYARELARDLPDHVRQVVTLGSPFAGRGTGTNVRWLFDLVSDTTVNDVDQDYLNRIRKAPPVPTTAIFSRTDGVATWRASLEEISHPQVENIEVGGSHIGLGFNFRALWVIGDRLAQAPQAWQPFAPRGGLKLLFPWVENQLTQRRGGLARALTELRSTVDSLDERFAG